MKRILRCVAVSFFAAGVYAHSAPPKELGPSTILFGADALRHAGTGIESRLAAVKVDSAQPANNAETERRPSKEPPGQLHSLVPKRWPVQVLSAIYGTGGKNADVTARVKEYVEGQKRTFSANPRDLGTDPNPNWNKSLHIIYMKDGVRREQRRNENETVLPESFYGPQDAGELRTWLPGSRWVGEQPEVQFHADGTFTSPGASGTRQWQALSANKLRFSFPDERVIEFTFDYTWSSFSEIGDGKHVYHQMK